MDVVGVSFHVGSGCIDASAFTEAIAVARGIFDEGARAGHKMNLLDIGGGFPGDNNAPVPFSDMSEVVNQALEQYFPVSSGVRVIAEPGRYYVSSSGTLAVNVISKRKIPAETPGEAPVCAVSKLHAHIAQFNFPVVLLLRQRRRLWLPQQRDVRPRRRHATAAERQRLGPEVHRHPLGSHVRLDGLHHPQGPAAGAQAW